MTNDLVPFIILSLKRMLQPRSIIQNPMDMATMLQRVDSGQYFTCSGFLQDIDLIVTNAKVCFVPSFI